MAAGAKLTQSLLGEVAKRRVDTVGDGKGVCEDWRASLVPAAAVIPAPGAHIFVAAVKMSVVGPAGPVLQGLCSRQALWTGGLGERNRGGQ